MTTAVGRFTLPETHAAYLRWAEATGLDCTSTTWGEVWSVLDQCGLLAADRLPQRSLFDAPDLPLGEPAGARALRWAVLAGIGLVPAGMPDPADRVILDPATGAAVVAALLEHVYFDLDLDFEVALTLLRIEVPKRIVAVVDTPGQALAMPIARAIEETYRATGRQDAVHPTVLQVLDEATQDDEFAQRVFGRLARDARYRTGLVPLCHGQWLVYRTELTDEDSRDPRGDRA